MLIDAHINITHNGKWFNTNYNASVERLMDEMSQSAIQQCLLISMPFATTNQFVASIIEKHPDMFRGLGHIDFSINLNTQIEEVLTMGFSGIKIHPRMQGVNCNSNELTRFFTKLNELGTVVMIDGYFQTNNDRILLEDLQPFKYDALVKKYKNIKFIFSHLGAHRVFDAYFLAKSNENVYLDNSHVLKYFANTSLIADYCWVMDKLDEKIIYGSDFPEYGLTDYLDTFDKLAGSNKDIRKELIMSNITKLIKF